MMVTQHNDEIQENLRHWENKPVLQKIYSDFHHCIANNLAQLKDAETIELGSGIGNIKEVIPNCIKTDLFPNPWLDRIENAFAMTCADESVSDLILFDVFHHLRYPGTALQEFQRVLKPGGRVHIFDPCIGLLGRLVFGLFHHEPIAMKDPITWLAPNQWAPSNVDYYAAQGNATRVFFSNENIADLSEWRLHHKQRLSAISYVASGGYSKPQLYPNFAHRLMIGIDSITEHLPKLFATRLLVVLEKQ